ncbi:hypothetical protein Trydic_g21482 [Trypoxylus dichotomus]
MEDVPEPVNLNTDPIEWATPIVLVVKSNGSIRICGHFSATNNPYVRKDDSPLRRFEDITAILSGDQYFSKLDLKNAYLQLQVHPESRKLLLISTHRGYHQYKGYLMVSILQYHLSKRPWTKFYRVLMEQCVTWTRYWSPCPRKHYIYNDYNRFFNACILRVYEQI